MSALIVKTSFIPQDRQLSFEDITVYDTLTDLFGLLVITYPDASTKNIRLNLSIGQNSVVVYPPTTEGQLDEGTYRIDYNVIRGEELIDTITESYVYSSVDLISQTIDHIYNSDTEVFTSVDGTSYELSGFTTSNIERVHSVQYPSIGGFQTSTSEESYVSILGAIRGTYTTNVTTLVEFEGDTYYIVMSLSSSKTSVNDGFYLGANNLYQAYLNMLAVNYVRAQALKDIWINLMSEITLYNLAVTNGNTLAASSHYDRINAILDANYN